MGLIPIINDCLMQPVAKSCLPLLSIQLPHATIDGSLVCNLKETKGPPLSFQQQQQPLLQQKNSANIAFHLDAEPFIGRFELKNGRFRDSAAELTPG